LLEKEIRDRMSKLSNECGSSDKKEETPMRGNIKQNMIIALCCAIAVQVTADMPELYLKLTRKNLPSGQEIVKACLVQLEFDPESAVSYRSRSRSSALLPTANIGASVTENSVAEWGQVDNYQTQSQVVSGAPQQSFDHLESQFAPTGYKDRPMINGWLEWDLSGLVISPANYTIDNAKITQDDQRHFLLSDVVKRYADLWERLPEEGGTRISASSVYKVMENATILDAMSGGLITRRLEQPTGSKPLLVQGDRAAVKVVAEESMKPGKQPEIIEVDDGQDDSIEKVSP
jgi:hypothetical protein